MIALVVLLAAVPANSIPVPKCVEPTCVITAVSSSTAGLYLGAGTAYCATAISLKTLPLTVNDASNNQLLCATDPAPNVVKSLVAVEQATGYTVTYSVGGVVQPVLTVPALAPPPPVVKTCTVTLPSSTVTVTVAADGSFSASNLVVNLSCSK